MLETMRAEIGEHAFRTWLQPLELVGAVNGSLTFQARSRFHRDQVVGRYVFRMEAIAGVIVEVVVAGAAPIERPPPPLPSEGHPDWPDFSQILQATPKGDDDPPPAPSTRRKVSGFSRAEIEAGALDARWPPHPPPDKPPATPDDPAGSTPAAE